MTPPGLVVVIGLEPDITPPGAVAVTALEPPAATLGGIPFGVPGITFGVTWPPTIFPGVSCPPTACPGVNCPPICPGATVPPGGGIGLLLTEVAVDVEGTTTTDDEGTVAVDEPPVVVIPVAAVTGVAGVDPVVAVTPGLGGAARALITAALIPATKRFVK
jgi:hypothetical protein